MEHPQNPIERFKAVFEEAKRIIPVEPNVVTLATVGSDGRPSARVVLLKEVDARGFVFFTNMESRKAQDLQTHPWASLCFYWQPLDQQVRVEGRVEPVSAEEADRYFRSRARGSQVGAWASMQSQPLASRAELEARVEEFTRRFEGQEVPRPPNWSGVRVVPDRIEFWNARPDRLHDRILYLREGDGWRTEHLYP